MKAKVSADVLLKLSCVFHKQVHNGKSRKFQGSLAEPKTNVSGRCDINSAGYSAETLSIGMSQYHHLLGEGFLGKVCSCLHLSTSITHHFVCSIFRLKHFSRWMNGTCKPVSSVKDAIEFSFFEDVIQVRLILIIVSFYWLNEKFTDFSD